MGDESEFSNDSEPQVNVISRVLKVCNQLAYIFFNIGAYYKFLLKLKYPLSFVNVNFKIGISVRS